MRVVLELFRFAEAHHVEPVLCPAFTINADFQAIDLRGLRTRPKIDLLKIRDFSGSRRDTCEVIQTRRIRVARSASGEGLNPSF